MYIMDNVKTPKKLKLYKALQIGYIRNNPKRQAKMLKKFGYILDNELSNPRETLVAYNPFKKKVLFVANGTEFKNTGSNQAGKEKDLLTDFVLAQGAIKQTERYKDTKDILTKAKDKYKDAKFVLAGASLGGNLVNYAAESKDKVVTHNAAFSPNVKARENVQHYRTEGDIISTFAPKENTIILKAKSKTDTPKTKAPDSVLYSAFKQGTAAAARDVLTPYIGPFAGTLVGSGLVKAAEKLIELPGNLLKPHDLSNIRGTPIFL
jgi:hypothetical protein